MRLHCAVLLFYFSNYTYICYIALNYVYSIAVVFFSQNVAVVLFNYAELLFFFRRTLRIEMPFNRQTLKLR